MKKLRLQWINYLPKAIKLLNDEAGGPVQDCPVTFILLEIVAFPPTLAAGKYYSENQKVLVRFRQNKDIREACMQISFNLTLGTPRTCER